MFEKLGSVIAHLKKRIKSADKGIILVLIGVVIMMDVPLGVVGAYLESEDKSNFSWSVLLVPVALVMLFGLAIFTLGLIIGLPAKTVKTGNFQSYLDEHQRALTIALRKPRCPNCGNEVPEGNFEFCPFCGNSLKS